MFSENQSGKGGDETLGTPPLCNQQKHMGKLRDKWASRTGLGTVLRRCFSDPFQARNQMLPVVFPTELAGSLPCRLG